MKIKLNEETVSMFLGLVIVVVVVGMIFNFFQKRRGEIAIPGVSDNLVLSDSKKVDGVENTDGQYVVKKGDNLWKIAVANYGDGYKWTEIVKENNLKTTVVEVGQKLKLSGKAVAKAETKIEEKIEDGKGIAVSTEVGNYKVVRGDNLWKIAVANYGDGYKWTTIWQSNKAKLVNPNKLEIGMELALPKLK